MGGCLGSSAARQVNTPVYQAILQDIYALVPQHEQLIKFDSRDDLIKYTSEYTWDRLNISFKQHLKVLIDHIEAYKIRLIDTAFTVENKIKLHSNPIIIKISVIILCELVSNLNKFVINKEVLISSNNEESKIETSKNKDSIPPISITYVSDNLLRFELIFSATVAQLIYSKQLYNFIWFDIIIDSLCKFAFVFQKQYQSENIYRIISYLEYILGASLIKKLKDKTLEIDSIYESQDQEQQKSLLAQVDELTEDQQDKLFKSYLETLKMIKYDKLFNNKAQFALFKMALQFLLLYNALSPDFEDNALTRNCKQGICILIQRSLALKQYEEIFNMIYQNFDLEFWLSYEYIEGLTSILFSVSKREGISLIINQVLIGFLQNMEIYLLNRFLEYLNQNSSQAGTQIIDFERSIKLDHQQSLGSQRRSYLNVAIKQKVIKLLSYILNKVETNSFILFYQDSIIKCIISNLKSDSENQWFLDCKHCLQILLQVIAPDSNSFVTYLNLLISQAYNYQLAINISQVREGPLIQIIEILKESVSKSNLFNSTIFIKDDLIYQILEIADQNQNAALTCFHFLVQLLTEQKSSNSISENDFNDDGHETNSFIFSANVLNLITYKLFIYTSNFTTIELLQGFYKVVSQRIKKLGNDSLLSLLLLISEQKVMKAKMFTISNLLLNIGNVYYSRDVTAWAKRMFQILDIDPSMELNEEVMNITENENLINEIIIQTKQLLQDFGQIDYEMLIKKFKEQMANIQNNDDAINIEEIQINDEGDRASLYQSFNAQNSLAEENVDESFEKILSNIKKQKQKQGRFASITQGAGSIKDAIL